MCPRTPTDYQNAKRITRNGDGGPAIILEVPGSEIFAGDLITSFGLPLMPMPVNISQLDNKVTQETCSVFFQEREYALCRGLMRESAHGYEEYLHLNPELLVIASTDGYCERPISQDLFVEID
jgi:hypothetical protein